MEITQHTLSQKEAKFDASELFFSITSPDSTILSGNEVFFRISGYSREETIGRYHNVVRHSDMPRVFFKILWDYAGAGKPIAGYVKNRTKEGDYYWVFAALFPLKDRIVSIRIKPTGPLLTAAQELYPILLDAERRGGMEESGAMIAPILNTLGYQNYEEFMSDALLHELKGRQRLVSSEGMHVSDASLSPIRQRLAAVYRYTEDLMVKYDSWFEKIDMFNHVKSVFEEKSLILRQVAREVVFLSLNASVSSYKVEHGGETFAILARDVRTNAKENDELIEKIDVLVHELSDSLNAMIFSVSGVRLQSEMLNYFIRELMCENCKVEHHEIESNMDTLITLVSEYAHKTDSLQRLIDQQMRDVLKNLDQLEQQMMYLGYIQVYGIIEAAGSQNETVSFEGIFSQLKTLIAKTSQELEAMQKFGGNFSAENRLLMGQSVSIQHLLDALCNEIKSIKQMER
ncbi:PAS domain-containing protein [Sulfuricurvum sp.]|uniref:PAS domain-containing protein n=1 Tax=Sulfuricurvum sp. TaxID=2025608 RepID=UPI002E37CDC0|nr:PAS domain-containing protein [Sulfuricurvum sp.]HEX5330007.1 PAS domain-containing protein [Sulfuricurvum sp.]